MLYFPRNIITLSSTSKNVFFFPLILLSFDIAANLILFLEKEKYVLTLLLFSINSFSFKGHRKYYHLKKN